MTTAQDGASAPTKKYLSPAEVASMLPGLTENALAIRRHRHKEPAFCRLGRTIVYPVKELQAWIDASTVKAQKHG